MVEFIKLIAVKFWEVLGEMSPYLLFGFFVAGILSAFVSQKMVERHLGGRGLWPLLKASLLGVPLPLCSCGVIPVSMSLHKHGASKGATIAFLLSTPQTGVDSIFVTFSLLGPIFAIFRPVAAFVTGLVGGTLVDVFDATNGKDTPAMPKCSGECCGGEKRGKRLWKGMKFSFVTLPRDIGKPLMLGLVIAALIAAIIPDDFFAEYIGTGILSMLVMMAIGIPLYVCASASVPIAAAMMMKGLTPGAALVFLMTGPATNAASFIIIWKTLGGKTAILYLISVAGCALLCGIMLNYVSQGFEITMDHHHHWMLPKIWENISAVALLCVLGYSILRDRTKK